MSETNSLVSADMEILKAALLRLTQATPKVKSDNCKAAASAQLKRRTAAAKTTP